jgi:hypothetical protein
MFLSLLIDILKHDLHLVHQHEKVGETAKKLVPLRWNNKLFHLSWSGVGAENFLTGAELERAA